MNISTLRAATRHFPLLGRPRPPCPSLAERINNIANIANAARYGPDAMADAAHALNKAALIASDCGLPEYARDLCWQHIDVYRAANRRLTVLEARYMLEPIVNLARLHIRTQASEQALQILAATYQSATANTDLIIDGRLLPMADLSGTPQQLRKLREWVWLQYLGDGIRALTATGRWDEAVTHAATLNGIGLHLMEGRQAAIIAQRLNGATAAALSRLAESTPTQPWEHQVALCLKMMCAETIDDRLVTAMASDYLRQRPAPGYAVFRTRLGLCLATLASSANPIAAKEVLARLTAETIEVGDGYAARDVLGHSGTTNALRESLTRLVASAGLGANALREPFGASLSHTMRIATKALAVAISET